MEAKKYQIFDGEDDSYQLVVTSNANILKVCEVLTQCAGLSNEARVYYAKHGGIKPEKVEGEEEATYSFKNRYDAVTVWPALARVLFFDGPKLVEYDEDDIAFVPEGFEKEFNKLIRSEVMRGRDDFLALFGVNPFEVRSLFKSLASAQIPLTINSLQAGLEQMQDSSSSETTSKAGPTDS